MIINPPPIHEPWVVGKDGKVNSPGWLLWFNELVTAGQMSDEFSGAQIYQTSGLTSTASTRSDEVVNQDDLASLISTSEATGARSSRVDEDWAVLAMMNSVGAY